MLIYEDEFQLAVTGKNEDVKISTSELPWPVRTINEDDIEQVVSVIRESFGTVADELGFTEENAPRFTAFATDAERIGLQLNEEHRPMYGYFDGDRLLGYYSLSPQEEGMCEINNLCVLPGHRHQKIGELLLLDSFSRSDESGFAKMNIGIVEENRTLRAWYEKYGFVHLGTQKFDFFPFTCGYMAREL
ncbi:MAG: GNAT family N-acetyltransferase [Lachnospiraceae bacterium]|nr:GNAT family N-acetyltransferase [Lachnospiraceae bacterium]